MVTLLVIKQDVLKVINKRDEVLSRLPVPIATTTIAGNKSSFRSTRLKRGTTQANRYDSIEGEVVEQVDTPGTGATIGSAFAVDDAGFDNSDQITYSPATDQLINTATDILLYAKGVSKDTLENAIAEMHRETDGPHVFYPSLFEDSELEAGVLNWTALGSPSTREVVTTSAQNLLGFQAIHFVASAADEGVKSEIVSVHQGEEFVLMVNLFAQVGTISVELRDLTNDATIGSVVAIDEPAWTTVQFTGTIPGNCETLELRIYGSANLDEAYISAHIVLQMLTGRSYSMPTWLEAESQILQWCYQPRGLQSEDADSFVALSEPLKGEQPLLVTRDERAVHPFRVHIKPGNQAPVAMIVQREFVAVTGNLTNSVINRQYAKEATLYRLLRDLGDPGASQWADASFITAERLRYGARDIIFEDPSRIPM